MLHGVRVRKCCKNQRFIRKKGRTKFDILVDWIRRSEMSLFCLWIDKGGLGHKNTLEKCKYAPWYGSFNKGEKLKLDRRFSPWRTVYKHTYIMNIYEYFSCISNYFFRGKIPTLYIKGEK